MKFTAAVLALAAGAMAHRNQTVVYTTEVVTAFTTFCPAATSFTYGSQTYTVTEATTLTITDCPNGCTIKRPVTTISSVICNNCAPVYSNSSSSAAAVPPATTTPAGTGSLPTPSTAGAPRALALSGAGLAGLLGIAAFVL
ncbi:uncharacterized protein THITE_2169147 [Thermothielavioides terrestris NRRL 8126]|uniref:Uncharacterized protein n=1 Tax=Thermothielavioides terrestris (strain ATCC 38088 / NRRL 8126) TaxID=578455 RepID=G2QX96_THETT|nr:uncharacterized protein THITE_2169147 [Thermothielavioides terrestris NRRL 8126]AEO62317.1 hypothetical protein THITE_2169147 [Thermothielavioides terrestris NRRL 8126]